jgi:hypothetical protein
LDRLTSEIRSGELTRFEEFIERVDKRSAELPNHLRQIHEQVYHAVCKGDPTPFKAFRRAEYEETVMKMGTMNDDAPVSALLSGEILITQEVRKTALAWREEGALIFGLSDKPDEASIPTPEMAALGYLPIHRIETHAVGG